MKSAVTHTNLFTVLLVTCLIGLIEGAPVFAQSFASPVSYTVGSNPFDGALGDFNGDGKPDLAILSVRASGILLTVEGVGTLSDVQGLNASYIIVRLPDFLQSGNVPLTVTLHGVVSSNTPTLEISP